MSSNPVLDTPLSPAQREYLLALADGEWTYGIKVDFNSYRRNPRLRAMERAGLVENDGPAIRDVFGPRAIRWRITDAGRAALRQGGG